MGTVSSLNSLLSSATSSSSVDLSSLLQAATGASSSGIDVTSAVSAAIYAARAPERQWQAEQTNITNQITALTSIQSALSTLSTNLNDLGDINGSLASRTVASSNSSEATATAAAGATTGTHTVSVTNLATTASWYSPALSSGASLGSSTLTITAASGSQYTFPTGPGTNSLTALASAINASSAGVNASVITDTTGSRLALVSASTGAASDFSVSFGASAASSWSSASVASASSSLAAGSFQISDVTSTATLQVNAGDTLSTVAASINAKGLGVSASVVTDSSGAHLQIAPTSGGSVLVNADPTFGLTRASVAQDASLTVDGIPVSSATNTVTGVIPGLTLNLAGTTPASAPVALSVTADTSAVSQSLSSFVSDYNSALGAVNSQFSYSSSSSSQGPLAGDSGIRSLQSALLGLVGYSASSGTIRSLSDLGITMANDGTLSLDSSKLNSALSDPAAVQTFFQGAALNGFASASSSQLDVYGNSATGSITQEVNNLNQQYKDLSSEINDFESGYIASQQTVLNAMYSKAEIALQELPTQMKEIQAQLGNNSSGG